MTGWAWIWGAMTEEGVSKLKSKSGTDEARPSLFGVGERGDSTLVAEPENWWSDSSVDEDSSVSVDDGRSLRA